MQEAVLIAGGYGVAGQQAAQVIRLRHPTLPLILAGRNPTKAKPLADELSHAQVAMLDVEHPRPLNGARPRAILAMVNDPHDHLLMEAIRQEIPYVDITRWTERMRRAVTRVSTESPHAPVMLSSAWMAGVAALVAAAATHPLKCIDRIDISILYSLKDKAGPNSAEYMDRLATPFEVTLEGRRAQVYPCTDPRKITFPGGYTAQAYRFDTPDQLTLPVTTGAKTVAARIAFDDAIATSLLVLLTRAGIWKLISGPRFTPLRRALLYNPGNGARHEMVIEATGVDEQNHPRTARASVVDPRGQTHLTALGTLIQLERLLGLDGAQPPAPGIVYPETAPQIESALQVLRDWGVTVTIHQDLR